MVTPSSMLLRAPGSVAGGCELRYPSPARDGADGAEAQLSRRLPARSWDTEGQRDGVCSCWAARGQLLSKAQLERERSLEFASTR